MTETIPPTGNPSQFGQQRPVTITATETNMTEGEVKPNHGASIPDRQAMGEHTESLASWQKRAGIDPTQQIQLVKLAHMRYQHPDLAVITQFLRDFGMRVVKETSSEVWLRGYGPDQYVYYARAGAEKAFLGGAFQVDSMADLARAAKLPSATGPVTAMSDAPGGGYIVTLTDPEGFPVNLIYGQTSAAATRDADEVPSKLLHNDESDKPRVRKFNRFTPGPAAVHKLGHYGLCVRDFDAQVAWYTRTFNFAPTDFLYVPSDDSSNKNNSNSSGGGGGGATKDVALFAHIDRDATPVDHHTFFLSTAATSHPHHASFEVHDYDTQQLGHQWLAQRGYAPVWGIGRHILGSQIFDYWWDPHGNMIEHYADGDLVNRETPVAWQAAGDESLAVWGPDVPKAFLD